MRSKILLLLLLPVLAYGGAIGYLWYQVKSGTDEAIAAAAPFAEITYESVHTSLLGDEVGLDGIVIRPGMTEDEFHIEQIRLSVPHIGHFLLASGSIEEKKLPEKLGVMVKGLELDIGSKLFDMLGQLQQQASTQGANFDALGCGDLTSFSIADMRHMGIGRTISDLSINSAYDEELGRMHLDVRANSRGLASMEASVDFQADPQALAMGMPPSGVPKINATYQDTGYHEFRNQYCARLNGGSDEEYVDRHIQLLTETLGVRAPEKTVAAYRRLMLKGGSLNVQLNPKSNLPAGGLKGHTPEEIVRMLGLKAAINGKPLKLDQIQMKNMAAAAPAESEGAAEEQVPEKSVSAAPQPVTRAPEPQPDVEEATEPGFRTIAVSDAHKHMGKMLEITTVEGKVRSGLLDLVEEKRIHLKMTLSRGILSYPVRIDAIRKIRVQD